MDYKVWFVTCLTGQAGTDSHEILVLPSHATQEQIDEICWEMALENAAMYGIYPPESGSDDIEFDGENEDEADDYWSEHTSENIEGFAVPYDPEEHDGHSISGSFADEIAAQVDRL